MSFFPETIAAALAGRKVLCATLAELAFTTETIRLWNGNGVLRTKDAAEWKGLGGWGGLDGIEQAVNGEAPEATFTLSGIDAEVMRLARDEFETEVRGRLFPLHIQFFGDPDADDAPDNQRLLDNPYRIWSARCLSSSFALDADSGERSVSLTVESLFSLRSRPRHAMYTDSDQQLRFPGDKGFEFVAGLVNKGTTWPDY